VLTADTRSGRMTAPSVRAKASRLRSHARFVDERWIERNKDRLFRDMDGYERSTDSSFACAEGDERDKDAIEPSSDARFVDERWIERDKDRHE